MNGLFRWIGVGMCLTGVIGSLGGQWLALQSVAWVRMFSGFLRNDSVETALVKTFDGKHPCPLCVAASNGWERQKEQEKKNPSVVSRETIQLFCETGRVRIPEPLLLSAAAVPFIPLYGDGRFEPPPTPPPRSRTK